MKRLILASTVILLAAVLTLWGSRLVGRALDAELGPLLTRELGLPVQLSPITAHLLQLKATSPKLVMGEPGKPSVVATDIEVSLVLSALLHGEIRLLHASATDLVVRPSRWPDSSEPLPDDYLFLDPWLPNSLHVETGSYISDDGESYPVNQLRWQRKSLGEATLNWWEQRQAGKVTMDVQLTSLEALLHLAPIEMNLAIAVAEKPESQISINAKIQSEASSAYLLKADIQAANMAAQIKATGNTPWSLPDTSKTTVPLLLVDSLVSLFDSYSPSDSTGTTDSLLDSTLPRLNLPVHLGQVAIKEIHMKDEVTGTTKFTVSSSEQGLKISALSSKGPMGILTGGLGITSEDQGWTVAVDTTLEARALKKGIAPQFVGTDWLWRTGRAKLDGAGNTWEALLNSLTGDVSMAGHYNDAKSTPVAIQAKLDNRPGEFALDQMDITLGTGHISGSAALSGKNPHKLTLNLKGEDIDLEFLIPTDEGQVLPGIAMPEYLGALPELNLEMTISVDGLQAPGLSLTHIDATLERTAAGGKLVATIEDTHSGTVQFSLDARTPPGQLEKFKLDASFSQLDIPALLNQRGLIFSRTSGTMNFQSSGKDMKDIFAAMQGNSSLTVELRADNNWQRSSTNEEKLVLSGESHLVIDKDRVVGVKIKKLDIDSIEQDLTGDISIVSGPGPWITADLESKQLNISKLFALLPKSPEDADDSDLLSSLKSLGEASLLLNVKSLSFTGVDLSNVQLEAASGTDVIDVKLFNFNTKNGTAKSHGKISWMGEQAKLEGTADLSNIDLDQFLIRSDSMEHIPVSGSAKLTSEGSDFGKLVSNMTGYIDLQATNPQPGASPKSRRRLDMKATQLPNGMQAEINSLQWGESELSGIVRYHRTTPPLLEVTLHSGALSLLPWENAELNADATKAKKKRNGGSLGSAAKASADFVGNILLSPLRLISGDENTASDARLFSKDPLPLDTLKNFNMRISGDLDSIESTVITAEALSFNGKLTDGQLSMKASSAQLSGGSGEASITLNTNVVPATFQLDSNFENVRGLSNRSNTYPRSGFLSIESQGQSQAELAASTNGLLYLELGKGPFDYANSVLLTANLASSVFSTLIPGIERKKPQIECGVTVALFKDGNGVTPYGFALRTNQANVLGRIHIDLGKETMAMSVDSRGRQGAGISVGSIFSNTIEIKGPLTDPHIVPNATGLLWRGWAAFMTAGLSVVGESMIKRVLASEDPCPPIKRLITEDLCPRNPIAASSEMVCPKT